jgi:hypothetical protein
VFVPIQAYRRQFGLRSSISLLIQARGGFEGVEAAADEARAVLRALRHTDFRAPDPFGLVTAEALQTLWAQISAAAFVLTVLIASVSLGIGGIVIMNIMLVAVAERTLEIGIRLATGRASATSGASSCWRRRCSPRPAVSPEWASGRPRPTGCGVCSTSRPRSPPPSSRWAW